MDEKLLDLVEKLTTRAPTELLDAVRSEIDYGEYGVAFDVLCEGLYAADVRLTPSMISTLAGLATEMAIDPPSWDFIRTLEEWPEDGPR